jgi:hypothetical protein
LTKGISVVRRQAARPLAANTNGSVFVVRHQALSGACATSRLFGPLLKVCRLRTSSHRLKRRLAAFTGKRAARHGLQAISVVAAVVTLGGCILTSDLPDPALDVPQAYKSGGTNQNGAPPALDWWRSFRSSELTALMEEAQTVNLDIAAATSRIFEADAQARMAGSALCRL